MLHSVDIRENMLDNPVKVNQNDNLLDAVEAIIEHRISGLLVVDDDDKLVGILSELDCLRGVLSSTYNESGVGPVKEYMTSENLIVANPSQHIIDLAQDMLEKNHRRRPVIEDGKLIGQITCRQLLAAVKRFKR
jgi:CBS domain-containing protein